VLLCCVEGLSREEAARRLGWSPGAVKGKLERGRERLAQRLAARGLAPSALLLGTVAVPTELIARTLSLAANPWSTSVPPVVAAMAEVPTRKFLPLAIVLSSLAVLAATGIALTTGTNPNPGVRLPELPATVPTGTTAAAPIEDDPLPAGSTQRFGSARFRHGTSIESLAVSDDGKFAVANSGGRMHGSLRGYDLTTGKSIFELDRNSGDANAIALSPDGKTLATKHSHKVFLYDLASGKEKSVIDYPSENPSSASTWMSFSPDGKWIVHGSASGSALHILDVAGGKVKHTLQHTNHIFNAAFSPDSKFVVGAGYDREGNNHFARMWDLQTGQDVRHFSNGDGGLRTVAFSPDGSTLALAPDGGSKLFVRLFDVATAKEKIKIPFDDYSLRSLAFSPDGKSIAVAGYSTTRIFDTATGLLKIDIKRRSTGLKFAPDGTTLIGATAGAIYKWDTATGRPLTPVGGDSVIAQIELTPDGKLIAVGEEGDVNVWDAKTAERLRALGAGWQRGVALSPDGKHLVWSIPDESVKYTMPGEPNVIYTGSKLQLYDLAAGQFIDRFASYEGEARDLGFTPDGKTLLTINHSNAKVEVWDVATGKVQRSFLLVRDKDEKAARYAVRRAHLSPDGTLLAVNYHSTERRRFLGAFAVRLYDVKTGKELFDLPGHYGYIEAMAFSPDSRFLITGGEPLQQFVQEQLKVNEDQVFVWNALTGQQVARLPGGATAGAFSPDGKTLATALPDGTIQLWDAATWKLKGELRGHRDRVSVLAFTPDGRLLSGGQDTTILAWDPTKAKPPE
jgi:WD40 repeat protein